MRTTISLEKFLREEAARSYDEYRANPTSGISAAKISADLDVRPQAHLAQQIRDGLASPNAGQLTKDKLNRLVREGMNRAARLKK